MRPLYCFSIALTTLATLAIVALPSTQGMQVTPKPDIIGASPIRESLNLLQQLLEQRNWKAADRETRRLVQDWVYPKNDLLAPAQFNALPCEDLRAIDTLWVKASNGNFGFSIQQQLWQQQKVSPNRTSVDTFSQRLGWKRTQSLTRDEFLSKWYAANWLTEDELNFTLNAPAGHLPWSGVSATTISPLIQEHSSGCKNCSIDALYLQEERNYTYLPGFFDRVKTCLATNQTDSPLETALAQGNWREANRLTSDLLLGLVGQKQRGYLTAADTRKLPCKELLQIDRLWVKYSQGHFGLSVQAQIWQAIAGKDYQDSYRFEELVGWKRSQAIFDLASAPKGHLPLRPALSEGIMNAWGGGWIGEMPIRLKVCRASNPI